MKTLLAILPLAMPLTAAAEDTPFAPMAFLAGHCWTGSFPDGTTRDTHCYAWIYGGRFLRDVHVVEGQGKPYCGETIYHADTSEGTIRFTYYNSLGGVSHGRMKETADGLFSPAEQYEGANGSTIVLRSWLTRGEADGYTVVAEQMKDGSWRQATHMEFQQAPGLDPASALNGACESAGEFG